MKAIILSAGQGSRLRPWTRQRPKCLLPIDGSRSVLELQIRALARAGVSSATVMVGFGANHVDREVARLRIPGMRVMTRFNPLHTCSDNLITAWLAVPEMDGDLVLLNGDTLFEDLVLARLLADSRSSAAIAIAETDDFDEDDMKVRVAADGRVAEIGKRLCAMDAEAIGMSVFRGEGVAALRDALESAVRAPSAVSDWYTSALTLLAQRHPVRPVSIGDAWWAEIDSPADLESVRKHVERQPVIPLDIPFSRTAGTGGG